MITTYSKNVCTAACDVRKARVQNRKAKATTVTSPIETQTCSLQRLYRGRRGMVSATQELHHNTWDKILCAGVPISLREIVRLTGQRLGLADTIASSQALLTCSWYLGWHVTTRKADGTTRHYWGGGVTLDTTTKYLRGDWIETYTTDTIASGVTTSRLARVICGVRISDVTRCSETIPAEIWETTENEKDDTVFFLLVRYADPHPHSRGRGPDNRPLCPGLLRDTHCLWSWAKRPSSYKRGCLTGRAWERNMKFFGDSDEEQTSRRASELRAWYDLVQVSDVKCYANIQFDPDRSDALLQSVMWV